MTEHRIFLLRTFIVTWIINKHFSFHGTNVNAHNVVVAAHQAHNMISTISNFASLPFCIRQKYWCQLWGGMAMAVRETTEIKIGQWRGVHALFVREQKPMHTHKQLSQFYPFKFLSNHILMKICHGLGEQEKCYAITNIFTISKCFPY